MNLSMDSLVAAGAFAPSQLVEKTVEFDTGEEVVEFTVFIKPLSYSEAVAEIGESQTGKNPLAARIAHSICDKNGKPVFEIGDITGENDPERGELSGAMTIALLSAISEVSGLGKRKSRLAQKMSSGTSLSSMESAEEPSPKPNRTSRTKNS